MSVNRMESIVYGDGDGPILRFGTIDRGGLDIPRKNSTNAFIYNDVDDVYRVNSNKKSLFVEKGSGSNLDIFKEEDEQKVKTNNATSEEEDDIPGGKETFTNKNNINFKEKQLTPLYIIMWSYLVFCLIEVICGYFSNSITLMADAAHYFAESSCFGIFILTIYVSRKKATNSMSFGFHRGEIIGILVRATFLFGFSFWLLYYIYISFIRIYNVNALMIIIIGIISTFFNLIMGLVLIFLGINNGISFTEKFKISHSKNECRCDSTRKTFTNIIFKGIQSCIIIVAGLLIYFLPSIKCVDPTCTLILVGILLYDAHNHLWGVITILMEGSPLEFDVEGMKTDLEELKDVVEAHDIHVWSLSIGKLSMSCHLTTSDPQNALIAASELIKNKYNITHTTIQVELDRKDKKKCKGNLH